MEPCFERSAAYMNKDIRIETNAGHGAGTPVSKTIEQYADVFGFTLFNMGFNQLPTKYN